MHPSTEYFFKDAIVIAVFQILNTHCVFWNVLHLNYKENEIQSYLVFFSQ